MADNKIEIVIDAVTTGFKKGIAEAVTGVKEVEKAADDAGKKTASSMEQAARTISASTVPATGQLAGALMGLINPASLAATAVTTLGTALIAYATSGAERIATLSETMSRHGDTISLIAAKYPELTKGLEKVAAESDGVINTRLQQDLLNYKNNLSTAVEEFVRKTVTLFPQAGQAIDDVSGQFGGLTQVFGVATSKFTQFQPAFNKLVEGLNSGTIDVEGFKKEIVRLKDEAGSNYEIVGLANTLLELFKDANTAAGGIEKVIATIQRLKTVAADAAAADFSAAVKSLQAIAPEKIEDAARAENVLTAALAKGNLTQTQRLALLGEVAAAQQRAADAAAKKVKPTETEDDGMTAQMQRRMQFIIDSTLTEEQLLVARYERNRLLLQEAFAMELADSALHGEAKAALKMQQDATIEALDAKHIQNLERMRAAADARTLNNMASTFGSIASIIESGGKKGAAAAKAFHIAQALMSTFSAATQAMADPTLITPFQKFAAYAAIATKGLAAVASIKSVNSSGGGGGGAAAAGAAGGGGAAAPAPTTTFQFTMSNDPMGFGEKFARQFIDQLNSTQRNGGQIRGVIA